MEYFANFADEVFFLLLVVVLILSLVDWLIGEQGRQIIRDRVGLFGIWLENHSYWVLMDGAMQSLYFRLNSFFSGHFFSFRPWFAISVPLLGSSILWMTIVFVIFPQSFTREYDAGSQSFMVDYVITPGDLLDNYIRISGMLFVIYLLNFAVVRFALRKLQASDQYYWKAFYFLLSLSPIVISIYTFILVVGGILLASIFISHPKFGHLLEINAFPLLISVNIFSVVILFSSFGLLFAKFTRFALVPFLTVVSMRFLESEKGVFTNI
ncbi:MAG: hypothetical protein AAFR71_15425 [Pseudomonadota bacterium]